MLRSLWNKLRLQRASWMNRSCSLSIRDEHHQPAYTLYNNDTSDIHVHPTPLESPSQSTLIHDRVRGHRRVIGHPVTRRLLAALIMTSFLAGLVLGLIARNNVTPTPSSSLRTSLSFTKEVTSSFFPVKTCLAAQLQNTHKILMTKNIDTSYRKQIARPRVQSSLGRKLLVNKFEMCRFYRPSFTLQQRRKRSCHMASGDMKWI